MPRHACPYHLSRLTRPAMPCPWCAQRSHLAGQRHIIKVDLLGLAAGQRGPQRGAAAAAEVGLGAQQAAVGGEEALGGVQGGRGAAGLVGTHHQAGGDAALLAGGAARLQPVPQRLPGRRGRQAELHCCGCALLGG